MVVKHKISQLPLGQDETIHLDCSVDCRPCRQPALWLSLEDTVDVTITKDAPEWPVVNVVAVEAGTYAGHISVLTEVETRWTAELTARATNRALEIQHVPRACGSEPRRVCRRLVDLKQTDHTEIDPPDALAPETAPKADVDLRQITMKRQASWSCRRFDCDHAAQP